MKITGFTIIRNAIKYDYPVVEAITSILPVCDEFVVAVGNSVDGTLELIKSINSEKIHFKTTKEKVFYYPAFTIIKKQFPRIK
jgi:hypothetical protein